MRTSVYALASRSFAFATLWLALACGQPTLAQDSGGELPTSDAVVKVLITAMQDNDEAVRIKTLPPLGRFIDRPEVLEAFLTATLDDAQGVRTAALTGLAKIGHRAPEVLQAFLSATLDDAQEVRTAALTELVKIDDPAPEVLAVIVKRGVEFGDLGFSRLSHSYYGSDPPSGISRYGARAVPHLIEVLESDADDSFKIGACEVLNNLQATGLDSIPALLQLVSDSKINSDVRIAAAEASATIADAVDPSLTQLKAGRGIVARYDKDGDGSLSADEFPDIAFVTFVDADANSDGKVTAREIAHWFFGS